MVYLDLLNISLGESFRDAEERFAAANPRSAKRFSEALEVMPGGNTRTVLHYTPFPLTITKGFGARLWDLDEHEYVDLLGEYTAGLLLPQCAKRSIVAYPLEAPTRTKRGSRKSYANVFRPLS